ncbi:MAG: WD40 repeat domain-containing protein, partial [Firmicutes bacterium]|nr:WD40 repeat domain-containing protein [Bacillota bacterium]
MVKKSQCLFLMFGLILLLLPISGCDQSPAVPEASVISGRVVVMDDQASGLGGVSLLIVDETSAYLETDAGGYFETSAPSTAVVVPRKTGYSFVPEKQVIGEDQELEFVAYPWVEPDFAKWGKQFSFDSHLDLVAAIAFSADDRYIASGSNDRTIRIWRRSDGQLVRTMYGHTSAIKVVAFSPQGHYLASGARDGKIKIWNWQTGQEVRTLEGHANMLTDLIWSPDGTKLASSGWDREVRVWDVTTGRELKSFTHANWVRGVTWSPDSRFLYSGGDDLGLKVWQVDPGELSAEFETRDKIISLSAAPQGSLVAMVLGNGALRVLNVETGEELLLGQYPGESTTLTWSFDARYLAVGMDRLIEVWDSVDQEWVQSIHTAENIFALSWGKESHLLASGGYQGIINL